MLYLSAKVVPFTFQVHLIAKLYVVFSKRLLQNLKFNYTLKTPKKYSSMPYIEMSHFSHWRISLTKRDNLNSNTQAGILHQQTWLTLYIFTRDLGSYLNYWSLVLQLDWKPDLKFEIYFKGLIF